MTSYVHEEKVLCMTIKSTQPIKGFLHGNGKHGLKLRKQSANFMTKFMFGSKCFCFVNNQFLVGRTKPYLLKFLCTDKISEVKIFSRFNI